MTTPDPTAIEAGARASYESDYHPLTWDALAERLRQGYLDAAAIHYAAMEPHIRKTVAEELTAATGIEVRTEIRNRLATFDASFSSEGQIDAFAQRIIDLIVPAARLQERDRIVAFIRSKTAHYDGNIAALLNLIETDQMER